MKRKLSREDRRAALQIVGIYVLVSALWILISDNVLGSITTDPVLLVRVEIYKGSFFVIMTAALLYRLISRQIKRSEEMAKELSTNKNLVNALLDGTTDAMYVKDVNGRYLLFNFAAAKVTGKTAEEVLGNNDTVLFPSDDARMIMTGDRQVMDSGRVMTYEEFVKMPDGENKTFLSTKGPIYAENGELYGLFGIARDITRRKAIENMLLESEERYRRLFEVESDAIFLMDCETGQFIEVNAAASALYGYSKEEFIALKSSDVSAEPDKTRRAMAEKQTRIPLRWHRRKDGTVFPVEIAGSYFEYHGRKIHVAAIRDTSDRVKAERALCESEERLSLALSASRMGVWEWDLSTGAALCSPECLVILGVGSFGGSVEAFMKALHPEDAERVISTIMQTAEKKEDYKAEFRIIRPSGEVRWVSHRGRPKHDENGNPMRLVGTIQDITEKKLAEESILESEKKYRELVESLYEGVLAIDRADQIIFVNSRMAEMLGYDVEQMLGMSIFSFIDRLGKDAAESYLHSHRHLEIRARRRFDFRRKDGAIIHTVMSVSPRNDSNDKYAGAIVCVMDITERLQFEQKIQQISITERHRIGRDLHDDLGQHLTGMAFMSKALAQKLALKSSAEATDAETLLALINEAINKTQILARGLCPMDPGADNFVSGLNMLASKTAMIYGISCSCNIDSAIKIHDNNQAMQLYYISKEAIHNAIKHGMAKNIAITMAAGEGKISLTIKDDGVGFQNKGSFNKGLGLDIMTYRAGMMNAWLSINGDSSSGTLVRCTFDESDGSYGKSYR